MAPSHLHAQTHTGTTCRKRSPQGVQSNFISPHMQDEDGHPQSSSTLPAAHHKVTVTHGFNHTGTLAIPSQGWLLDTPPQGTYKKSNYHPGVQLLMGTGSHGQGEF